MSFAAQQKFLNPVSHWFITSCLVLLTLANTALAEPPRLFEAHYELLLNRLPVGTQRLTLSRQTEQLYVLETHLRPNRLARLFRNSSREESSLFRWSDGIISERYQLDRQDSKSKRHAELIFNWDKRKVLNDVANERWVMPIPEGTLDKLNVQIAVMQDLKAGKTVFGYQIADGGKLKHYQFEVIAEQTIRTAGRKFHTVKLKRIREDQDRITYLWCAPDLDYLPVKIQQTEKEDRHTYISRLTSFHFPAE